MGGVAAGEAGRSAMVRGRAKVGGVGRVAVAALMLAWGCCVGGIKIDSASCNDGAWTPDLLGAGAFHTCMANGSATGTESTTSIRHISCIGWQEFGQGMAPAITGVTKIAGGARHSCAADKDYVLSCWGGNGYGQTDVSRVYKVDDGSGNLVPEKLNIYCLNGDYITGDPSDRQYKRCVNQDASGITITLPFSAVECALPDNRQMVLRGLTADLTATPIVRNVPSFRTDGRFNCAVHQISAGGQHTCVIYGQPDCTNCNYGYTICYGSNVFGQSDVPVCDNDPSKDERLPPEVIIPSTGIGIPDRGSAMCSNGNTPATYTSIGAGLLHTCAVHSDGHLVCWGDNSFNQSSPPGGSFLSVSSGAYHSCAIDTAGEVACWGNNTYGERQNQRELITNKVIPSVGGTFHSISCGAVHTCGVFLPRGNTILASGSLDDAGAKVVCWGADYAGQSTPPEETTSKWAQAVSVGWEHSCATTLDDHQVVCWGATNWKTQKRSNDLEGAAAEISHCTSLCQACTAGNASTLRPFLSLLVMLALLPSAWASWGR